MQPQKTKEEKELERSHFKTNLHNIYINVGVFTQEQTKNLIDKFFKFARSTTENKKSDLYKYLKNMAEASAIKEYLTEKNIPFEEGKEPYYYLNIIDDIYNKLSDKEYENLLSSIAKERDNKLNNLTNEISSSYYLLGNVHKSKSDKMQAYLWVSSPLIYNLIFAKNPDGTEFRRIEKDKIPSFKEEKLEKPEKPRLETFLTTTTSTKKKRKTKFEEEEDEEVNVEQRLLAEQMFEEAMKKYEEDLKKYNESKSDYVNVNVDELTPLVPALVGNKIAKGLGEALSPEQIKQTEEITLSEYVDDLIKFFSEDQEVDSKLSKEVLNILENNKKLKNSEIDDLLDRVDEELMNIDLDEKEQDTLLDKLESILDGRVSEKLQKVDTKPPFSDVVKSFAPDINFFDQIGQEKDKLISSPVAVKYTWINVEYIKNLFKPFNTDNIVHQDKNKKSFTYPLVYEVNKRSVVDKDTGKNIDLRSFLIEFSSKTDDASFARQLRGQVRAENPNDEKQYVNISFFQKSIDSSVNAGEKRSSAPTKKQDVQRSMGNVWTREKKEERETAEEREERERRERERKPIENIWEKRKIQQEERKEQEQEEEKKWERSSYAALHKEEPKKEEKPIKEAPWVRSKYVKPEVVAKEPETKKEPVWARSKYESTENKSWRNVIQYKPPIKSSEKLKRFADELEEVKEVVRKPKLLRHENNRRVDKLDKLEKIQEEKEEEEKEEEFYPIELLTVPYSRRNFGIKETYMDLIRKAKEERDRKKKEESEFIPVTGKKVIRKEKEAEKKKEVKLPKKLTGRYHVFEEED